MDYKSILKSLKAKDFSPIYFLESEEAYFIDQIVDYIEKEVLDEAAKAFNQVVLYGKETDFKQVLDQARQYPMMSEHRVVIIKEAQELRKIENLVDYFNQPTPSTILVIAHKHKSIDKRKKKLWDALKKNATILESKKIYENQVPKYVIDIAQSKGLKVNQEIAALLTENLGTSLSKINNELEKLALNLEKGAIVSKSDVETYVGISKDFNVFELQKAIGNRDKKKAYQIIKYFADNQKNNPIQMHVGVLFNYFSKLFLTKKFQNQDNRTLASKLKVNPFFVKDYQQAARNFSLVEVTNALQQLHELDKRSKGLGARQINVLGMYQEFIFSIFNHR